MLVARNAERLEAVAAEISAAGGEARTWPLDCADREAVGRGAAAIEAELGLPDVVVNCAGAGHAYFFEETPVEEYERMMAAPGRQPGRHNRCFSLRLEDPMADEKKVTETTTETKTSTY